MANLDKLIKEEIKRITARETRQVAAESRKGLAALKQRVRALEQEVRLLRTQSQTFESVAREAARKKAQEETEALIERADEIRMNGNSVKKIRTRLGLSQADFGLLLGVSTQSIYVWERKGNALKLKPQVKAEIARLRTLGKRAVSTILEQRQPALQESDAGESGAE